MRSVSDAFRHRTPLQVRFRDIDAFGHVNNAVFLTYIEQARVTFLTDILDTGRDIHAEPLILARVELDFRSPIRMGEPLVVTTRAEWIGRSSFGLAHRVLAGDDERLAGEARTVLVAYDYATSRPIPVPHDWRMRLTRHEGRPLERAASADRAAS
jgi:acyl-CoA thioester hydrolase